MGTEPHSSTRSAAAGLNTDAFQPCLPKCELCTFTQTEHSLEVVVRLPQAEGDFEAFQTEMLTTGIAPATQRFSQFIVTMVNEAHPEALEPKEAKLLTGRAMRAVHELMTNLLYYDLLGFRDGENRTLRSKGSEGYGEALTLFHSAIERNRDASISLRLSRDGETLRLCAKLLHPFEDFMEKRVALLDPNFVPDFESDSGRGLMIILALFPIGTIHTDGEVHELHLAVEIPRLFAA